MKRIILIIYFVYQASQQYFFMKRLLIVFFMIAPVCISCGKIKDYLKEPETQVLGQNIQASYAVAFAANVSYTEMIGHHVPNVIFNRSSNSFPCTSLAVIKANAGDPFLSNKIGEITIAGLWTDTSSAIFTILFTNLNFEDAKYSVLGINTFPMIRQEGKTLVIYGSMDIDLNPNSDVLLSLNLSNQEVESEYARTEEEKPDDVYVAVSENGYFIDIDNKNTPGDIWDDTYTIFGGGQAIEMTNTSIGIFQQAMVGIEISSFCLENPTAGYALLKKVKTKDSNAPELGTVVFEFRDACNGQAKVTVGTGEYIGSNGKSVDFKFD